MKTLRLLLLTIVSCGCSTAGPFISNISSDGQGNLIVEKSMVEFNGFIGYITTKPGTSSFVTVVPNDNAAQAAQLMIQQQELRAKEAAAKKEAAAQRRREKRKRH